MWFAGALVLVWALWPLGALAGGQLFSPLVFLAGVAALFAGGLRRPNGPAWLGIAFLAWAALSTAWSPAGEGLMSGELVEGDFSVDLAAVRIGATGLAALALGAAALQLGPAAARWPDRAARTAQAAQAAGLVLISVFLSPVTAFADGLSGPGEGVQNLIRNANLFALVLPLLLGCIVAGRDALGWAAAAGLVVAMVWVDVRLGSQSACLAVIFGAMCWVCASAFRRSGFRVLGATAAGALMAMPGIAWMLGAVQARVGMSLPDSFNSRLWSWEAVLARIAQRPFFGHGLDASETWQETYASRPDLMTDLPANWAYFRIVPGHPHNMALQIWAETGLIGACLAAGAICWLGFRLPRPDEMASETRIAVAGLFGAAAAMAFAAYSAWNEAFWGALAIAATGVVVLHKRSAAT